MLALVVLMLLCGGFAGWVWATCFAAPPPLDGRPAVLDLEPHTDPSSRVHLGASWFEHRHGRSLLYLEGDPFTLGYANARLTADLLAAQERALIETVRHLLPGTLAFYGTAVMVLVHNRRLPHYVSNAHQMEILGLSTPRQADPYRQFGSRFHRILNYHAAHDISHWVHDRPAVGCTAFAAAAPNTRSGHLLVGRNFDWESGDHFDSNKVIALYRPATGLSFLSVSWPGMAGAVTGLNEAKIYCSLNGAHSEHMGLGVGRPVSLVVRDVLQHASTLDRAVAIVREAPVFVADTFLLADGKSGTAVVVEKTPKTCAVRAMHHGLLVQSNHFETEQLRGDRGNLEYLRDGTTLARRARMAELLERHAGALDPTLAAAILRDRRGPSDAVRGLGHRGTINPMIATHSVVADVTDGVLWVSRGPHQLGAFDAYTIAAFGTDSPRPSIPADVALTDGTYWTLSTYRKLAPQIEADLAHPGPLDGAAWQRLRRAAELNPAAPEVLLWQAQAYLRDGAPARAAEAFRAARRAEPPFAAQRTALEADMVRVLRQLGADSPKR
ncbi:MAG: hypothetical protein H6837_08045 [Planctomycetes bacterium]|nr:hypothetical protein [Planctomycetota bacterium]